MTFEARSEYDRREAIRAARFEAFALRAIEANRAAREKGERLLEERLRGGRQLTLLDYVI